MIYASRTHKQLSQVMGEFKRTKYNDLLSICLASREHYCVNDDAKRDKKTGVEKKLPEINGYCRDNKKKCQYYEGGKKSSELDELAGTIDHIRYEYDESNSAVIDIEDLIRIGIGRRLCPYFASQTIAFKTARVIFTPYNYLLDQLVKINLANSIVIFDEGHNIESACEDAASGSIPSFSLLNLARGLETIVNLAEINDIELCSIGKTGTSLEIAGLKSIISFTYLFYQTFDSILKKCINKHNNSRYKNSEPNTCHNIQMNEFHKILFVDLQVSYELMTRFAKDIELLTEILNSRNYSKQINFLDLRSGGNSAFFNAVDTFVDFFARVLSDEAKTMQPNDFSAFLQKNFRVAISEIKSDSDATFKGRRRQSTPGQEAKWLLNLFCMNPGVIINRLTSKGIRSIIISSGTLAPMDSFEAEMGISFPQMLCNPHVIAENQLMIFTISNHDTEKLDGTFKNESARGSLYYRALGCAVARYVSKIPAGVLLFFKSYAAKTRCFDEWSKCGIVGHIERHKKIFHEPQNKEEFAEALEQYKVTIDCNEGGIFAAVYRGKVSEGLDLANDYCRGAIIIGLPYPYLKDPKVDLKRDYLMKRRELGLSSEKWYENQMLRAVNQAVGRIVRHKSDYGIVLLLDVKYEQKKCGLSKWLHKFIRDTRECKSERFDSFFRENATRSTSMSLKTNLSAIEEPFNENNCNHQQTVGSCENSAQLHPHTLASSSTSTSSSATCNRDPVNVNGKHYLENKNDIQLQPEIIHTSSNVESVVEKKIQRHDEIEVEEWQDELPDDFIRSLVADEGQRPCYVEPSHKKMRLDHHPVHGDGVRAPDKVFSTPSAITITTNAGASQTTTTAAAATVAASTSSMLTNISTNSSKNSATCCMSTTDNGNDKSDYEFDDSLDNIFDEINVNELNEESSFKLPSACEDQLKNHIQQAYETQQTNDWLIFKDALMKYKQENNINNFIHQFNLIFGKFGRDQLKTLARNLASNITFTNETHAQEFKVRCVGDA